MSFRVWEDSKPQWIKRVTKGSGSMKNEWPEDELNGKKWSEVSSSEIEDMNQISAGKKLGSYTYTSYYNVKSEKVGHWEYSTSNKTDSNGNTVYKDDGKTPETVTTRYWVTEYYLITYNYKTTYKNCVHKETHDWLGSYQTEGGTYTISGLYPGSYEIYETECDQYYDLELQDGYTATGTYHDVSNIRFATTASLAENDSETVKLGLSSSALVHNDRTRGDIEITKKDEKGEPVEDVQIAIYGNVTETIDGTIQHYEGWLTGEESYEDVTWSNIGSIFGGTTDSIYTTTEEGKISITGLPVGTYSIYEIKTKSIEYALEGQGTFDRSKTLLGTCEIARDMSSVGLNLEYVQVLRPKGNLTIKKKGFYRNNNLSSPNIEENLQKVQFILQSSAIDKGGWKEGEYVYITTNDKGEEIVDFTSNREDATVFTTDENGEVTVSGLYTDLGPYTLIEVENSR